MSQNQTFKLVPVDAIVANPVKLREVDQESVAFLELVDSVRKDGVINPPTVRIVAGEMGEEYQLVDGLHRLTAARAAGLESINVQVKDLDDTGVLLLQISMNSHTIETKPIQYTKALLAILAARPFMTHAELGKEIGKSGAWIKDRLSLSKITNETIQGLVDEGKISLINAYSLASLPEAEQLEWVTAAQTEAINEFAPKIKARLREIQAANRQSREAAPTGFVPVPLLRKFGDLTQAPEDTGLIARLASKAATVEEAVRLGIQYTLQLDPESVAEQEARWHAKKEAEKAAKLEREKKREAAAAAKAAEAAGDLANI